MQQRAGGGWYNSTLERSYFRSGAFLHAFITTLNVAMVVDCTTAIFSFLNNCDSKYLKNTPSSLLNSDYSPLEVRERGWKGNICFWNGPS